MTDASLPSNDPVNTFNMEGFGGSVYAPHKETTTYVITKRDRTRLGNVDNTKSLTENLTTVIDLYERALMTPSQIDAANPSEVFEAEHVIELAFEVLRDKVVSCDTCKYLHKIYDTEPCDGCIDFSEWERSRVVNTR